MKIKEYIMTLFDKLLGIDVDNNSYKMANLYVGWISINEAIEFPDKDSYHLSFKLHGPIICYKSPLSSTYVRVSNGIEYLKNTQSNNSLEIGDSYFTIIDKFIDFVHKYMYGFEKATKEQYLAQEHILNIESLLQRHMEELEQTEQAQNQY